MFNWNDEELTNIIWGEAGESDDHIVPDQKEEKPPIFGHRTKKERNQENANVSPVEQKKPTIKSEHGVDLDSSSKYDPGEPETGFGLDSWPDEPDPSLSDAAKANQDSMGTAACNTLTNNSNNDFLKDETVQFNKDSEIFQNPPEDTELDDFVDYGWANIGSFDDLNRIFSNDDPIFGDVSVGNADELWSSSKDDTSSRLEPTPLPGDSSDLALGPLRTSSDRSEIKAQYMLDPNQSFISGCGKLNKFTSHTPQDLQASIDTIEPSGGNSKLLVKEKTFEMGGKIQACHKQLDDGTPATLHEFPDKFFSCVQSNRQQRLLKGQKLDKKSGVRQLHNLSGTWSSSQSQFQQVSSHYAPSMINPCPPLVLTQQRQLQRPASMQHKIFSGPLLASPLYGNVVNHYPATYPGDGNRELVSSGYEVPPGNANTLKKTADAAVKPPAMTPKEKIEKLRKRQQMRAILAIQKQQQQFGNQVAVAEHSSMEGGNIEVDESLSSFLSLDPNSPIEHDDSITISMAFDNYSVEESVLHRLQDTIAKLDVRIRLCIRDSLFRLAQSSMHRQYLNDTSSTNTSRRDEVFGNKNIDNHERFTGMPDVETDTNPIDRNVAHLLFHRPLDLSGKPADMPEPPVTANLPYERNANSLKSLTKGVFPDSLENTQMTSQGSKSLIFSEGDQSKINLCFDTSENASNNEAADEGLTKVEASK